jgi:hypothetical protein
MRSIASASIVSAISGLAVLGMSACDTGAGAPAIFDIQPRSGRGEGNQPIRITGRGFRSDIGYSVYFGPKKSDRVVMGDPQTLLVLTPAADRGGPVDIQIRADDGHAWKIAGGFAYDAPTTGTEAPAAGPAGAPTKAQY